PVAVTRTAAEEQQASSSTDNIGRPQQVFREFEEIFFQPSVEAHQGYHGNRI
ncbi:unnamed protein product, partial [Ascophyllum nodosum]